MLNKIEQYRFVGELHRQALHELPETADIGSRDKSLIRQAARQGWWLGIGVQLPVVLSAIWFLDNKVKGLSLEKKAGVYILGVWAYGMYYMISKAWAWHYAFGSVEHIVKDFVLTADIEEIRKIQQEKELGLLANPEKVYLPKNTN